MAIECREPHAALRRAIEDVLSDAPRAGSPGTFTAEQVTQVLAVACEDPSQSGRPIDDWTARELAAEVVHRKIVESISPSTVQRYLAQSALQPHRSKYWLNTTEKDPEVFEQPGTTGLPDLLGGADAVFPVHTHTVSVDEMTGIQALERNAKKLPMAPGQPARIEFEYTRHGTLCLTGNWHVVLGQMIAPTIRATRAEEDFCWHIRRCWRIGGRSLAAEPGDGIWEVSVQIRSGGVGTVSRGAWHGKSCPPPDRCHRIGTARRLVLVDLPWRTPAD